jgi:hypothetical protein
MGLVFDFLADFLLGAVAVLARIAVGAVGLAAGILATGYRRLRSP